MLERLTFITGNAKKAEQLGRYFSIPVDHQKVDLPEIQSLDLQEIVEEKAREAYKVVNGPVFVEDVSLTFRALGKLPGPLIKWFLQELGNEGLCHLLNNYEDRSATAEVLYGLYDGKSFQTFSGKIEGTIAPEPRGVQDFGWNSTFIPEGYSKTWAEMNDEEQRETSMRRQALEKLESFLENPK